MTQTAIIRSQSNAITPSARAPRVFSVPRGTVEGVIAESVLTQTNLPPLAVVETGQFSPRVTSQNFKPARVAVTAEAAPVQTPVKPAPTSIQAQPYFETVVTAKSDEVDPLELTRLYRAGYKLHELARRFKRTALYMRRALEALKLVTPRDPSHLLRLYDRSQILSMRAAGQSCAGIARAMGCSLQVVYDAIAESKRLAAAQTDIVLEATAVVVPDNEFIVSLETPVTPLQALVSAVSPAMKRAPVVVEKKRRWVSSWDRMLRPFRVISAHKAFHQDKLPVWFIASRMGLDEAMVKRLLKSPVIAIPGV